MTHTRLQAWLLGTLLYLLLVKGNTVLSLLDKFNLQISSIKKLKKILDTKKISRSLAMWYLSDKFSYSNVVEMIDQLIELIIN